MNKKTAILIFSNSAEKDAKQKSFLNSDLFEALNSDIIKKVKKTGLPYFLITENEQIGHSFGERFTNAIQHIFDKGFKNVISVGNDTPHLTSKHLKETYKKLSENQLVLGPSKDGGFYLMGLNKTLFNPKTFRELPWQSKSLKAKTLKLLTIKNIKVELLEQLYDIDSVTDIKAVLESFKSLSQYIKSELLKLSIRIQVVLKFIFRFTNNSFTSSLYNKGSPLLLHI